MGTMTANLPPSPVQSPLSPPLTEDTSILSNDSGRTYDCASPDVIRRIPKPQFPVPVFKGEPPPFSLEAQRSVMQWTHERRYFLPDPIWLKEPCTEHVKDTVWPHLERLGADYASIEVEFLAEGGFDRVYIIHTNQESSNTAIDYAYRVALPVDPYFKTESEVATMELVRHFTNIPVPIVYAYDSSTANPAGVEWILMEKVKGKKLAETWESLDYDSKLQLTKTITSWTTQLSKITAEKIGNIYMRYTETNLEFYVGRCVNYLLSQENRLTYDVFRGPFKSLEEYYAAVLDIADQDVTSVIHAFDTGVRFFEPTLDRPKFKGTFLDQSVFYYLEIEYEDKTDEDWKLEQTKELEKLSVGIKLLRAALPKLCAKAPASSGASTTYLFHNDLSRRNIFVDDTGTPIALIDWEALPMKPLLCLTDLPDFIDSREFECEPDEPVDNMKLYKYFNYSEEEKQEDRESGARAYAQRMEQYTCTKLRRAHLEELNHIGSPLAMAVWENFDELDRDLLDRVLNVSRNVDYHAEWIEDNLGTNEEDEEGGSGEEQEESDEEDSSDTEVIDDVDMEKALEDRIRAILGPGGARFVHLFK
ncbi:hypothetical protein P7C71_g4646, partial [Lecanoromycetidae sp. Uapishka_2]